MPSFVSSAPGTSTSPLQGGRAVLAPGIVVKSVHASASRSGMGGGWNDVEIELLVDPQQVNAIDNLMDGLRQLINGQHPIQTFNVMTSATIGPMTPGNGQAWVDEETLDEIEGEMERDPEDIEDMVTLVTLKKLIEERMDDVDAALRLAIGE